MAHDCHTPRTDCGTRWGSTHRPWRRSLPAAQSELAYRPRRDNSPVSLDRPCQRIHIGYSQEGTGTQTKLALRSGRGIRSSGEGGWQPTWLRSHHHQDELHGCEALSGGLSGAGGQRPRSARPSEAQHVPVDPPKRRAGDHHGSGAGQGLLGHRRETRPAVGVGEGLSLCHLLEVGRAMKLVGLDKGEPEAGRKARGDLGPSRTRHAHHDDSRGEH